MLQRWGWWRCRSEGRDEEKAEIAERQAELAMLPEKFQALAVLEML